MRYLTQNLKPKLINNNLLRESYSPDNLDLTAQFTKIPMTAQNLMNSFVNGYQPESSHGAGSCFLNNESHRKITQNVLDNVRNYFKNDEEIRSEWPYWYPIKQASNEEPQYYLNKLYQDAIQYFQNGDLGPWGIVNLTSFLLNTDALDSEKTKQLLITSFNGLITAFTRLKRIPYGMETFYNTSPSTVIKLLDEYRKAKTKYKDFSLPKFEEVIKAQTAEAKTFKEFLQNKLTLTTNSSSK